MTESVLILSNEQMEGLITMKEAIEAMEMAFREFGEGKAYLIPRGAIQIPKTTQPDAKYYFYHMAAALKAYNIMALRIDSRTLQVREVADMSREELPGDFVGLVLLFDIENNELNAILHDGYLSPLRVAATSGLVAQHLARQNISVMGLFGAGVQARVHAKAMCEVRSIQLIKVYTPIPADRESFAHDMTLELGVQVQAMDMPRPVVEGSDIVVAATNSNEPVFRGEWLEPGTHVITIRGHEPYMKQWETDEATARRADVMVFNYAEVIKNGHLGLLPLLNEGALHWEDLHEVTDLVLGKCQGRSNDKQITVHYNNIGLGIQWAAVAYIVHQRARGHGIGTEIPAELFITRQQK